jgi:hypothetical protein
MTRRPTTLLAGVLFASLALAGPAAQAQPAPDLRDPARAEGMRPERDPAEHLRAILQLRPVQEPALQAFLASMKPGERDGRMGHMAREGMASMPKTTPERLAMMDQRMAERTTAMRAKSQVILQFYAQLDPAQKRAFDALPMGHMHGGGMKHMRGPGRGMHDGHEGPMGDDMGPPPAPGA